MPKTKRTILLLILIPGVSLTGCFSDPLAEQKEQLELFTNIYFLQLMTSNNSNNTSIECTSGAKVRFKNNTGSTRQVDLFTAGGCSTASRWTSTGVTVASGATSSYGCYPAVNLYAGDFSGSNCDPSSYFYVNGSEYTVNINGTAIYSRTTD